VLIFGFRTRAAILATLAYICDRCGVSAAHRVARRRRWFTLFFIPVFPIAATKYTDTCINCGRVRELTKEQADSVLPPVPASRV
jgi:zinc-ribbon family